MINASTISRLMGKEQSIKLENGITLDKMHGTVIVGKVKDFQLEWVENFDNLPTRGRELLAKMLRARKVMMSFDTEFRIIREGVVIEKTKTDKK